MVPMRAVVIAACAVLLIVSLPSVLAEERTFARLAFDSPSEATARVSSTVDGEDATNFRQSIDFQGDGDGAVTQEEVDAFEEQFRSFFEGSASGDELAGGNFTMDGKPASSMGFDDLQIEDAAGDANSTQPVTIEFVMKFAWDVTPADSHTLLVRAEESSDDERPPQEMTFELSAPPGYRIGDTSGAPEGSELSGDDRTLTMTREPAGDQDFEITFEKAGGLGGAPGPGLAALVGVGALAVYLRRRVHL